MFRKHALSAIAALAGALSLAGTPARIGAGETLAGLAVPGRLVVGLDDTFAPMGFRDPANNLVGFDIDLAKAVGEEMGLEIVFQPIDWSAKEMELAAKNIDCIWNGMSRTPEREASMTLSQDYLNNRLVVMTNPGVEITDLKQLASIPYGTQASSSSLEVIRKSPEFPLIRENLHEYPTYDECILDMRAGRIQAMVVDEVLGQYKNNNLGAAFKTAPVDFGNDYYVIGFRRSAPDNSANEQLRRAVEKALRTLHATGKGAEISGKWFGENLLLEIK
ncbi:MAG: amino acid ABC transporter substrate-binding protein [Planctomycetota bacterium]|jgi:polar amino acid transport system substrate-binding protein|nr:amino acid ABC transporter substrate-binding protein [Planctomycetota bacterium]